RRVPVGEVLHQAHSGLCMRALRPGRACARAQWPPSGPANAPESRQTLVPAVMPPYRLFTPESGDPGDRPEPGEWPECGERLAEGEGLAEAPLAAASATESLTRAW